MKKLNRYERGFIEGIIDGEGYLEFSKQGVSKNENSRTKSGFVWRSRLSISNNSLKLLNKVQRICGKGFIVKKPKGNYELRYGSNVLRKLLPQIKLVVKERKRRVLTKALSIITFGRNQYTENYDKKLEKLLVEFKN